MTQPVILFITTIIFILVNQVHFLNGQSHPRNIKSSSILPKRSSGNGSPVCLNPYGKYGHCIPITKCESLYQILKENPINRKSVIFLQKSTCGFSEQEPDVCCLTQDINKNSNDNNNNNNNDIQSTPTTTTTTEETTTHSSTSVKPISTTPVVFPSRSNIATLESLDTTSTDIREKIQIHPNLKLFPTIQTCGKVLTLNNIIGGHDAGLGTYPWIVLLGFTDTEGDVQYACGGTLINKNYVLTAAHCVAKLPLGFKLSTIRIGEYDQSEEIDCSDGFCAPPVQDIQVQEIIYHNNFDKTLKKENDIALVRLKKPAEFGTFVAPICLPLPQDDIFSKGGNITKLTVAGWGRRQFNSEDISNVLQEVKVPIITLEECNRFYKNDRRLGEIDEGRFCSGGEANKDSCKGDSGGPIMGGILLKSSISPQNPITRVFQFGIVSIGPARCGTSGQPALYTKVSYFIPWILDHMRP